MHIILCLSNNWYEYEYSDVFQVIDLLNPGAKRSNLTVRWNKRSRAFVVDNLFSIECGELDDLVAVLEVRLSYQNILGVFTKYFAGGFEKPSYRDPQHERAQFQEPHHSHRPHSQRGEGLE